METHSKQIVLIILTFGFLLPCVTLASTGDLDLSVSSNYNFILTGGGGTAGRIESNGNATQCDIDGDGRMDFVIGAYDADYNGRDNSGSVWVIDGKALDSYSGTGNVVDLTDSQIYKYRFDGPTAGDSLAHGYLGCADVNNNGKNDLLIGTYHGQAGHGDGNMWVVYDSIFSGAIGTGNNFDLASSTNWNLRFDSNASTSDFTHIGTSAQIVDINRDSQNDIIIGSQKGRGGVFVLYHNLINSFLGTGNVVNLASSTNYNIRFYGADNETVFTPERGLADDLDNNGNKDLIIRAGRSSTSGSSIYIVKDSLFSGITGTGNNINLATSTNYSFRLLAPSPMRVDGIYGVSTGDIYGDGKKALVFQDDLGTYNSRSSSGAVYVFDNTLLGQMFIGGGTFNIASSSDNYSFRFEGPVTQGMMGQFEILDFDSNGSDDIIFSQPIISERGQVFYVYDSIYRNGGVKNYDLASSTNYSNSLLGPSLNLILLGIGGQGPENKFGDYNGDGKTDSLFINNASGEYSGKGALYLIFNYPHAISLPSAHTLSASSTAASSTVLIAGTISAPNSVTTIGGVQYSLDSRSLSGTWNSCSPSDGAFDSKTESFICSIPSLVHNSVHDVYIRSYDSNISYTATSSYGRYHFITDVTPPTSFGLLAPRDEYDVYAQSSMPLFSWENSSDDVSGLYKYQLYVDDALHTDNLSSPWVDVPRLSDGVHTWYVVAMDYNGNTTRSSATYKIHIYNNSPNTGGSVFTEQHATIPTTTARVSAASSTPMILVESIKTLQIKLISLLQQLVQLLLQAQR